MWPIHNRKKDRDRLCRTRQGVCTSNSKRVKGCTLHILASVLNSRLSRLSRPTTVPTAISSPRDRLTSIPTKPTACLGRKGGRGGEGVRERPERSESSSTLVNSHNLGPRLTHLTTLPGYTTVLRLSQHWLHNHALASPAVRASVPCCHIHEGEALCTAVFLRHLKRWFLDAKECPRRTRSEEGGIGGRPGSDHPSEDTGKLSMVYTDCASDACASRTKARAKKRFPSNFRGGSFPIFDQWAIIHQNLAPY